MKFNAPTVVGLLFTGYLAFAAIVMMVYEPTPDDMHWEDRQAYNQASLAEIVIGQPLSEIKTLLGKADFSEAKQVDDTNLQVLFYRTHHSNSDGKTTKDECTPLLFKQGKLVAWGEGTYQQYLEHETKI